MCFPYDRERKGDYMKVLVINGSANKERSTTMQLTKAFLEGMEETGEVINTVDLKINPCHACYACWVGTNGHCIQKDDAIAVMEKIRQADVVIWSLPLYAYGAPSHSKALMDRTLCFNKPEMYLDDKGIAHHYGYEDGSKKTVLISTGGLPSIQGNFDGLVFQMKHMYGRSTQTICCGEGSLFMQKETAALVEPYLMAVKVAGAEYKKNGVIGEETQKILDSLIVPADDYIKQINALFGKLKKAK